MKLFSNEVRVHIYMKTIVKLESSNKMIVNAGRNKGRKE